MNFIKRLFLMLIAIIALSGNVFGERAFLYKFSASKISEHIRVSLKGTGEIHTFAFENTAPIITNIAINISHTATSDPQMMEVRYKSPTQPTFVSAGTINIGKADGNNEYTFTMPEAGRNATEIQLYKTTTTSISKTYDIKYFAVHYDAYTLTFDAQGGASSEATRTIAKYGTYGTLPTAFKPGYVLDGWYDAVSGGTQITPTMSVPAKDHTIYAHWSIIPYVVTLDKNNGTGGTSSVSNVYYGQAMPAISSLPTRDGYTFKGYSDVKDSGTLYYNADGSSAKNWDKVENTTLYALWETTYYAYTESHVVPTTGGGAYISIYGNWPTEESQYIIDDYSIRNYVAYAPPTTEVHLDAKTNRGYTFKGWFDNVEGVGSVLSTDLKFITYFTTTSIDESNPTILVYYAIFSPVTPTVTFDPNGGTVSPTTSIVTFDATYEEGTGGWPIPTRSGYTFIGWFTAADKSGREIKGTDKVDITVNGTLYAHWESKSYNLWLRFNGGTKGTSTEYKVSSTSHKALKTDSTNYNNISWTIPENPGYVFTGFYDTLNIIAYDATGHSVNGKYWNNKKYIHDGDLVADAQWEPAEYVFVDSLGDHNWHNVNNWRVGTDVPSTLPTKINKVLINAEAHIYSNVEVYGLNISNTINAACLIIEPTGGINVYNGGVSIPDNKITIKSSIDNTGFMHFMPSTIEHWNAPIITMQYASKGDLSTGADNDATWQYFGIPVDTAAFTPDNETWLYRWDERLDWVLHEQNVEVQLLPFQGYAITQYTTPTYNFTGHAFMSDRHIILTKTEDGMKGDNLIANSYPAPIDAKRFTVDDFSEGVEKTFYIFNSGSWNNWNEQQKAGQEFSGNAPGTYTAIPVLAASLLEGQTLIPPMQGIYIKAKQDSAWVNFSYEKHVWYAKENAEKDNMNDGLRVPNRKNNINEQKYEQRLYDIKNEQNKRDSLYKVDSIALSQLKHRICISISGENSGVDKLYLLENDKFSSNFDNGYDAHKESASNNAIDIYVFKNDEKLAVEATNDIDNAYISIKTGSANNYTLKFSAIIGDSIYLVDLDNNVEINICNNETYNFNANPYTMYEQRFVIKKYQKDTSTNIEHTYNNVIKNTIYDITGNIVLHTNNIKNLPLGVYIINNNGKMTKIVNY